jgi:hypothetical protein
MKKQKWNIEHVMAIPTIPNRYRRSVAMRMKVNRMLSLNPRIAQM